MCAPNMDGKYASKVTILTRCVTIFCVHDFAKKKTKQNKKKKKKRFGYKFFFPLGPKDFIRQLLHYILKENDITISQRSIANIKY